MKSRHSTHLALYRAITGKTTHAETVVPGDGIKDQAKRLGYWPDRSAHYSGW